MATYQEKLNIKFSNRLKMALKIRGMKQTELCEKTKIPKSRMSQYVHGSFRPKDDAASLLAKALNVSKDWLLGDDVEMNPFEHQLRMVSDEIMENGKRVPLLGDIACGLPILAEQNIEEYIFCTDKNVDFAIKAKGDSMIGKRIFDGDIVFIKKTPEVENGEIAAVLIGNEATLKVINYNKESEMLMLISANDKYPPLVYIGSQVKNVQILGKAISFQGVIK